MFLRTGCMLPDGIDLTQEQFCEKWMSVEDTIAAALDVKIRNAGWHFIWLQGSYSRSSVSVDRQKQLSAERWLLP
jgi:hypothetical protein